MGALSPLQGIGPDDLKIKGLLTRIGDGVTEVILATNPERRGRGDGHLSRAAAQAARRARDAHRDGRAGRQRSRVRRRSDDAQGARRAARGLTRGDAAARLRAARRACCWCSAARSPASPATGCSASCSAIYGFILGAMLASSMMGISNTVGMVVGGARRRPRRRGDSGVRVLRRRSRSSAPGSARWSRTSAGPASAPAIRRRWPSSSSRSLGRDRRDVPAALRDHRRHGVRRRVDADRRRARGGRATAARSRGEIGDRRVDSVSVTSPPG